jgi:hypothetical protein
MGAASVGFIVLLAGGFDDSLYVFLATLQMLRLFAFQSCSEPGGHVYDRHHTDE